VEHVNTAWPAVTCPHGGEPYGRTYTVRFLRILNKGAEHLSQDELGSLLTNLK